MRIITTTEQLGEVRASLAGADFVTVDTEFMRDSTYWPRLCLVQLGGPEEAVIVDPLANGLDLAPLLDLMADPGTIKVFHAGRQDIEIFFHLSGAVPTAVFDTQIAAMVCGFGDSVSYEKLAGSLANARIDKSSRFTDWSRRPLSSRQLDYALGDVTHLRTVYQKLVHKLEANGRETWLDEEMAELTSPATYNLDPDRAWKRVKTRATDSRFLAVLVEVAAWRERQAQDRDTPRRRVLRDEALLELAGHPPKDEDELERLRGIPRGFSRSRHAKGLISAVSAGLETPRDKAPKREKERPLASSLGPVVELLKVLLKMKCSEHGVAQKLICNTADLERFIAEEQSVPQLCSGWRHDVFGRDAMALRRGELGLSLMGNKIRLTKTGNGAE